MMIYAQRQASRPGTDPSTGVTHPTRRSAAGLFTGADDMRTIEQARIKQIIAKGEARRIMDEQLFAQRRAEKAHAAIEGIECEANANSVAHAYQYMDGAVKS